MTFFFDCLLFMRSPIQVPTRPGAAGLHLRLSRFPAVTHPIADRARCCLTFFFACLLFRRTSVSVVSFYGSHPSHCRPSPVLLDLIFGCPVFRRSPIPLPVLLDDFLRLSPLQVVTHPRADLDRFSWTSSSAVPFSGGHPSHCRPSPVLLDYIFGYPVSRRSPIPLPTEHGAA